MILWPTGGNVPGMGGKSGWKLVNGNAKSVPVETGERTDEQIEVLAGIEVGDTIITTGLMQIRSDASIKITEIK